VSRAPIRIDQYTSDAFTSLVGQVFHFHQTAAADDAPVDLELIEVHPSPHRAGVPARQPFSLLFALRSANERLESTVYLRHDDFEPCAWFVNRVAVPERDPLTQYYEAVFG